MTIHDLGCSRKREHVLFSMEYKCLSFFLLSDVDSVFSEFVSQPEMRSLYLNSTELFFIIIIDFSSRKQRIVWVHVDLPGQEDNAAPLNIE